MSIEPPGAAMPASTAGPWLDDAPVAADWAPPTGSPPTGSPPTGSPAPTGPPGRRVPAGVVYAIVALSLVLIAVSVWGLGGLKRRTDVFRDVPTGSMISTGPYELSFTEVTAQLKTDHTKKRSWEVTARGSGRTTGASSMTPTYTGQYGMFVARDPASGEAQLPSNAKFGDENASLDRDAFTPGLGPVPYAVTFKFGESYRPGTTLRFVVYDLDFYDNSLLGDGEEAWHNSNSGSRLTLPVRVLPEESY